MPSKLNTRNFLYKKKNICRSISAAPLHIKMRKWPISIVLLTLGILELFRVGSLPNPTQGIFDYDLAKGAWKIERPLLLPYNFCHSQKFLVLNLEEVPLEKFSNLSNRTERGPFMIPYRVERQKWSGKYFFSYVKNSLCWIWKVSHSKKFQNSAILVMQLKEDILRFHIKWSGKNRAADNLLFFQKFLVLNLEGIPLKKIPKFDNFYNITKWGHFTIRYLLERQK